MPSHVGELNYPSFVCQEEAITTPAPTDIKLLASVEGSICPCVASTLLRALSMDVFIPFPELLPWSFPFSASTDVDSAQKQFPMFLKDDASALPRCPLRTHSPPTDSLSLSLFFARRHQVARPPLQPTLGGFLKPPQDPKILFRSDQIRVRGPPRGAGRQ